MKDKFLKNLGLIVLFIPVCFLVSLAVAWILMLGWNLGLADVFKELPKITYWQAFWMSNLSMWFIHRPDAK